MTAAKSKLTVASDLIYTSYDKPCCLHCKMYSTHIALMLAKKSRLMYS